MSFKPKEFDSVVSGFYSLVQNLLANAANSKSTYEIPRHSEDAGILMRCWNNGTDYELSVNDITRLVVSEPLNTAIFTIRASEIVFNTITLGVHSLSGTMVLALYEGDSAVCFSRMYRVLEMLLNRKFAPVLPDLLDEDTRHEAVIALLLIVLTYTLPDSKEFSRYCKPKELINYLSDHMKNSKYNPALKIEIENIMGIVLETITNLSLSEAITRLFYESELITIQSKVRTQLMLRAQQEAAVSVEDTAGIDFAAMTNGLSNNDALNSIITSMKQKARESVEQS